MNEKKWKNIWRILQKTLIFAPLLERSTKSLDYGVMAAQQVLVLFVLVRIQVVQRKSQSFKVKPRKNDVFTGFAFFRKLRAMKNASISMQGKRQNYTCNDSFHKYNKLKR